MKQLMNGIAILLFSLYVKIKGYKFSIANSPAEKEDCDSIFDDGGYKLPETLKKEMDVYKVHSVKFIAYHKGQPVGTVSLADPKIINRPFELHGIDEKAEHFEIQNLVVSRKHRDCSQLVLLGLFREMYLWSVKNAVNSWISLGKKCLYITMRRYNKNIMLVNITEHNFVHPMARYLHDNDVFDTCTIMNVADFAPSAIVKKFISKRFKKINFSSWFDLSELKQRVAAIKNNNDLSQVTFS